MEAKHSGERLSAPVAELQPQSCEMNKLYTESAEEFLAAALEKDLGGFYTVCFVCTGNTCRSPMAEAYINYLITEKRVQISLGDSASGVSEEKNGAADAADASDNSRDNAVADGDAPFPESVSELLSASTSGNGKKKCRAVSAGLSPFPGEPISEGACAALDSAGIPSTERNPWRQHRSRRIDEEIMRQSDAVIAVSARHAFALISEFPQYASKVHTLPTDISDPWGGGEEEYKQCFAQLRRALKKLFSLPDAYDDL